MNIPLSSDMLGCVALAVEPKLDFESGQQKYRDGVPQWSVRTFLQHVGDVAKVTVTTEYPPTVTVGSPVTFVDLTVGVYGMPNGRSGFFFNARGVQA